MTSYFYDIFGSCLFPFMVTTTIVKPAPISQVKSVVKENLTVQTQSLLEKTTSDDPEKKHDHYLKISIASIGLAAIGKLSPPLGLLSIGAVSYASLPILKQAEKSLVTEGKIGHDMLISILTSLALFTGQVFALSIGILFYHISRKVLAKTQDHSKKVLTHLFEQQPHKGLKIGDRPHFMLQFCYSIFFSMPLS